MKATKIALLALLLPLAAHAKSPWRVPVNFSVTTNTGVGYSMFVVGNHPDLGNWNPLKAVPLAWHDGNVWSAEIGIKAGTELEYKYIKRPTNASEYPDGDKTEWWPADNLTLTVPSEPPAPFEGKRVVFRCPWDPPVQIVWTTLSAPSYDAETEWHATDLVQTDPKNDPGRYEGFAGEPGEWMRFTFSGYENGEQKWYHFYGTEDEDFWSPLDAFCVNGGQVFDYEPTNGVSDSRIVSTNVGSSYSTIAGRDIRIYLPRGYDENTNRYYPVVYMSDGQQIFSDDPSASYGGWKADTAADREIRGGRMREAILVGVPCRDGSVPGYDYPGSARLWEYLPGTDCLMGIEAFPGLGTDYARFLVHNVKPTLDWHYRTLQDRDNTAHVGSSAGGLLSFYLGTAFTEEANVFGLIGAISGVYTEDYIPNLRTWCFSHLDAVAAPKRIWLDTGTEETDIEGQNLYGSNWDALTLLLYAGHISNKSFHFGVYSGWEGEHKEPAWAARSPDILRFLLPVTDEPNPLLPLELSLDGASIRVPLYPGLTNTLLRVPALSAGVDPRTDPAAAPADSTLPVTTDHPWAAPLHTPSTTGFFFLRSTR